MKKSLGSLGVLNEQDGVSNRESFNFLVVSALQEELNEFYSLNQRFIKTPMPLSEAFKLSSTHKGRTLKILTYTPNRMGMPFNATAIMRIISIYQPVYTFFIGTCAGLKIDKRTVGDVLVPHRVFSYESGKYENGKFLPDYISYETGEFLRKEAEHLNSKIKHRLKYQVITDEDFCSGAAVIDDEKKRDDILMYSARKVSGLDMEAYALACINMVLRSEGKEAIVIKGIMDFAMDKADSEQVGNKELAKKNAAAFTYELIKHLDATIFNPIKEVSVLEQLGEAIGTKTNEQITSQQTVIIHSAIYGADGDNRDVLDKIAILVSQGILEIPIGNWLVDGPEPAMGKEKTLVVNCSINGQRKIITTYERQTLKIE
jgi:nucleoside phosphorylase